MFDHTSKKLSVFGNVIKHTLSCLIYIACKITLKHSVKYVTMPRLILCTHHLPMVLLCHSYICLIDHTLQKSYEHAVLLHTSRHVGLQTFCIQVLHLPGRTSG